MSEFFQRAVVCNTSPVISLCKAGLGHLFAELFPKVLTTAAVAAELRVKDAGDAAGIETVLATIEIFPAPPLDPMLATGGSGSEAVRQLKAAGAVNLTFVSLLAAPEGLERLHSDHPDLTIVVGAVDRQLNEKGYIQPGLGDAGDRQFGTGKVG